MSDQDRMILRVKDVCKCFGELEVLRGISFELREGGILAVIGPSGSGKSTLLRGICQLEQMDSGSIEICGEKLFYTDESGQAIYAHPTVQKALQLKLGMVFQVFHLFPHLSILENITEAPIQVLKKNKKEAREQGMRLLSKLGMADKADAYPYQLSGGQQQRVSIARALALNPAILCFDEPTSALDPELTGEVLKVMLELARENMTMLVVTHEMRFAAEGADHVIFMDEGVIIEEGTPSQVFHNTNQQRTKQFLQKLMG